MTCRDVDRWLDGGMKEVAAPRARAHAASCPRCAAALAATFELEALLRASPPAVAPAGFTMRVMERVVSMESRPERRALQAPTAVPVALDWWVRAAADPAVACAAGIAALVVWRWDRLQAAAHEAVVLAGAASQRIMFPAWPGGSFHDPAVQLGLLVAAIPLVALLSLGLYRWTERLVKDSSGSRIRAAHLESALRARRNGS